MPSKFRPQRRLKRALSSESTHYKTIQTKYVFKTSFDGRSGLFQTTLISHCLTSLLLKLTLILAKSLTSDPYNRGPLFWRKSVASYLLIHSFSFRLLKLVVIIPGLLQKCRHPRTSVSTTRMANTGLATNSTLFWIFAYNQ